MGLHFRLGNLAAANFLCYILEEIILLFEILEPATHHQLVNSSGRGKLCTYAAVFSLQYWII